MSEQPPEMIVAHRTPDGWCFKLSEDCAGDMPHEHVEYVRGDLVATMEAERDRLAAECGRCHNQVAGIIAERDRLRELAQAVWEADVQARLTNDLSRLGQVIDALADALPKK